MKLIKSNVFWCIVMALLLVCGLVTACCTPVHFALGDTVRLTNYVTDDDVVDRMYDSIAADLSLECNRYGIPWEKVQDAFDKDKLKSCVSDYFSRYLSAFLRGNDLEAVLPNYADDGAFLAAVNQYAVDNPDSVYGQNSDNCTLLAEKLTEMTEGRVGILSNRVTAETLKKIQPYAQKLQTIDRLFLPVFLCTDFLLICALVLAWRYRRGHRCYAIGLGLSLESALFFIPFLLLYLQNIPEKLVLTESAVMIYFSALWKGVFLQLLGIYGIAFAGFGVLAVLGACRMQRHHMHRAPSQQE